MTRVSEFEELRPLLFSIAYRILGSVTEAEDVVQESWLRYETSSAEIASTKAFLSAVTTRLAIDVLRLARSKREVYVGPWFPEPLVSDPYQQPERSAELADSLSMASLLLLERLSPLERAVFVLRDVFGYEFSEIAASTGRSEDACRQLAVRARRHMEQGRPRFSTDPTQSDRLAASFFGALKQGDVEGLRQLLISDVQLLGDAGGKAPLWGDGVYGADKVSRVLASTFPWFFRIGGTMESLTLNGQPGAVMRDRHGRVVNTLTLEMSGELIGTIRSIINPDKLRHLGPVADAWEVVRDAHQARRSHSDSNRSNAGEPQ